MAKLGCVRFTLSLLLFLQALYLALGDVYYIIPTQDDPCYADPCLTLADFAVNVSSNVKSNTTLFITGGVHNLDTRFLVSNVAEFSILSMKSPQDDQSYSNQSEIICSESAGFTFSQIDRVYVSGLTFLGCGGNRIEFVDQLVIENADFLGQRFSKTPLIISESNANLTGTNFLSNTARNLINAINFSRYLQMMLKSSTALSDITVGGALVLTRSTLSIDKCLFEENSANIGGSIFSGSGSNIIITDSVFTSNHASGCSKDQCYGGAVFIDGPGSVTVTNSTFQNNTSDGDGGVAVVFNATLVLSESELSDNSAKRHGGSVAYYRCDAISIRATISDNNRANLDGGSVYSYQSSITLQDSDFSYGQASENGGVLLLDEKSTISISNSMFSYNEAGKSGGVISTRNATTSSSVLIYDSEFTSNMAITSGGVIHTPTNVEIIVNRSRFDSNLVGSEGGTLDGYSFQIYESNFTENVANGSQGVIRLRVGGNLHIESSNFRNNRGGVVNADGQTLIDVHQTSFLQNSASRGGVISVVTSSSASGNNNGSDIREKYDSNITLYDSIFSENRVNFAGGVVYGNNKMFMSVQNGTFTQNSAHTGGVFSILRSNSVAYIRDSIFRNNSAANIGGVVSILSDSNVTADHSIFAGNSAIGDGAVIYASDGTDVTITNSCEFHQNRADFGGVLFALRQSTITVQNSTFSRNKADTDGATLHIRTQCSVTITNSTFTSNSVTNDGIMYASDNSNITLEDSTFSHNEAGDDGGVGYVYDNSKITVNKCNLSSNKASDTGGSLYARMVSVILVNNSEVYNSTVENSGGVVYAQQDSNAIIENSIFNENLADYGGVIRVYVRSTTSIFNSSFSGNRGNIEGGVIGAYKSSIVTVQASFFTFSFACFGGVSIVYDNSSLTFVDNHFINNSAEFGAIIRVLQRNFVNVTRNTFQYNTADLGGILYAQGSEINFESNWFEYNSARLDGGVINGDNITVSITNNTFSNNTAIDDGGSIALTDGSVATITNNNFLSNSARDTGGVIQLLQESNVRIFNSMFLLSTAQDDGGALHASGSYVEITNCTFTDNSAVNNGGAMVAQSNSSLVVLASSFSGNNVAQSGGVIHIEESSSGEIIQSVFKSNSGGDAGGVISLATLSNVTITASNFTQNTANLGGALSAESNSFISFDTILLNDKMVDGEINIDNNTALSDFNSGRALSDGGGIYLSESRLFLGTKINILNNVATKSGGGIHALDSSITVRGTVQLGNNRAMLGGGLSLADSKLYNEDVLSEISFVSNQADYGGALYVDDESDKSMSDICSSDSLSTTVYPNKTGCFFQNVTPNLAIHFGSNFANFSGHNLFGGLLDRCTVVSSTDPSVFELDGVTRLEAISNIDDSNLNTISSEPVRVCLCKDDVPDCSQQIFSVRVRRGDEFSVPVAAVDQVNQTVTATVQSSFRRLTLSTSETVRKIDSNCTDLGFQVSFPTVEETYDLALYAEGPCEGTGISRFNVSVYVLSCTCGRGFNIQADISTECVCQCDNRYEAFSRYIQDNCDLNTNSVIRRGQFWLTYLEEYENTSISPYLFYPYCPLDYCQSPTEEVHINLNLPNGSDTQCTNNRGGFLCGSCLNNYSLSLGSSKCLKCPDNWYILVAGITIAAILAGIILVITLLVLNITVAIGTINSIIFYANIINANRNTYFSQPNLTFVPVFISWLNLDIGFDTCFYQGMDTYAKTWLQLAFPTYIIFLVVLIIILCRFSSKFSNLLGKRNPVATLATLILLSYTKYLQIIIISFSFAPLRHPSGTIIKWFPDANIQYFERKHVALICVAILIIIIGLAYTIIIFSWQWLLRFSRSKLFKWTRNHRLHSFIDTYHTPHTAKHRYWTGLLLFIRVIIYIVAAFSLSVEPRITLLTTVVVTCFLFLYKTLLIVRVYKNWLLNAMESFVYFNIASFTVFTWYAFDDSGSRYRGILQTVVTYISIGTIVILFLFVLAFHAYRYCSTKVYSMGKSTKISKKLMSQISLDPNDTRRTPLERDDYNLLNAIDSPRDAGVAYNIVKHPVDLSMDDEPTTSTISLNNCEESLTTNSETLQNGQQYLDSHGSSEQEQHARSDGEDSSRLKFRAESQPSQLSDSYQLIRLNPARKAKTKSFTFSTTNETITKPLLEEESL